MNEIDQFIIHPSDYRYGISLLEKYGGSAIIIRKANNLKERGIPAIIYELKKLVKKGVAGVEVVILPPSVPPHEGGAQGGIKILHVPDLLITPETININLQTDPVLELLKREMQPLLQERSHLHEQLFTAKDQEKRAELAFRIVQIDREDLPPLYAKKEFYLKNGRLPDVVEHKKELAGDPISLNERKLNLRSWISRYRNDTRQKYIDKVIAWKEELLIVEGQIGIIKNAGK